MKMPENIALCCAEIAGAIGWGREAIYKALQRLSQRGILSVRPSTTDPRHKVYRLAVNMGDTPPSQFVELSNVIPEVVEQQGLEDIGHSLDSGVGHQGESIPELSNQVETTVTTDIGHTLDNHVGHQGECQNDVITTTTDIGHTLDNHVGHQGECQNDVITTATDIGHTLDNHVGHQGERVDGLDRSAVANQALILSDPLLDAEALEYLTAGWTTGFKQAVYAQLSEEVRSRLREIVGKLE
ncbi:MAG: hypothetical protein DSM106950_26550 [Stigonema ocellatum SAG 48.90 = DSM 106950]|nr:hypothetical protein [Stigonema ocellatum SAG 48.90 = DSM 106950]